MTALAVDFETAAFAAFLSKTNNEYEFDLSNSTCVDILKTYEQFKRKKSPNYKCSQLYKLLQEVEEVTEKKIYPSNVTDMFWVNLELFMHKKDMLPSTIKNYFDSIARILDWASHYGVRLHSTYRQYKIDKFEKKKVALDAELITTIYNYDFDSVYEYKKIKKHGRYRMELRHKWRKDKRDHMKIARDHFVLMCNLGQRYSDAKRIEPEHFGDDCSKLRITQQKTGHVAVVDLNALCITPNITKRLLKKYNYTAPCSGDISNFNKRIHEMLREMGGVFNTEVRSTNKILGNLVEDSRPMWKAITSHTGRRSFITDNIESNKVPEAQIRRASGHVDQRTFDTYYCPND